MSFFAENLNLINFIKSLNLNDNQDLEKLENILLNKTYVKLLIENVEAFTNLSASKIYALSPYIADKEISKLAIMKDSTSLNHTDKVLLKNREFMESIIHDTKGFGIYYLEGANARDEQLMEKYIFEIFLNEKMHVFPTTLSSKEATQTYKKVLSKLALDINIKKDMISYYKQKENLYYSIAKLYGKNEISDSEQDSLTILSNKIGFMTQNSLMELFDSEEPESK